VPCLIASKRGARKWYSLQVHFLARDFTHPQLKLIRPLLPAVVSTGLSSSAIYIRTSPRMKPMFALAAAMPGHPNGIDLGGGGKCHVFHNYDGKKRPRGESGLVRGGCFETGAGVESGVRTEEVLGLAHAKPLIGGAPRFSPYRSGPSRLPPPGCATRPPGSWILPPGSVALTIFYKAKTCRTSSL
jgi:hypothetical protein